MPDASICCVHLIFSTVYLRLLLQVNHTQPARIGNKPAPGNRSKQLFEQDTKHFKVEEKGAAHQLISTVDVLINTCH